jgi:hypothetical protein
MLAAITKYGENFCAAQQNNECGWQKKFNLIFNLSRYALE